MLAGDGTLAARTYLWMFPIYGLAGVCAPLFLTFRQYCPLWLRAGFYAAVIFAVEFLTGWLLRFLTGACPWDYGERLLSVMGLIRLDYAPLWVALGLFFEQVALFLAKEGQVRE